MKRITRLFFEAFVLSFAILFGMSAANGERGKIDNGGGIYPRISGTPSESAVDAVIIDPPTGRISTVRYGAGIDREFVIRN